MMLAAVPPSRMIPWTRAVGRSCWRHRPTEVNSRISASSAFLPFHGSDDGVGLEPVEDDVDVLRRERLALDVVAVARVVQQGGVEALEQPVVDHDLLAAAPLLGGRAEEDDLAGQLVGDRGQGDGRADPGRRPSCCGRSRGRARAARRTRRGSRSAGRRPPRPPRRTARIAVARLPGRDARPRSRGARSASATQAAAWCSSKAGSGLAWIRCDRSRISSRARLDGGGEARLGVGVGLGRAGGGQRRARVLRLGMVGRRWRQVRRRDGTAAAAARAQRSAERVASATSARAKMNSAIGSSSTPCSRSTMKTATMRPTHAAAPGRAGPVAAVGDPAVAAEDRQPADRRSRSARRRGR